MRADKIPKKKKETLEILLTEERKKIGKKIQFELSVKSQKYLG